MEMTNLIQKAKENKVIVLLAVLLLVSVSYSVADSFGIWFSKPTADPEHSMNQADYSGDVDTLECIKRVAQKYVPEGELNKCVKSSR